MLVFGTMNMHNAGQQQTATHFDIGACFENRVFANHRVTENKTLETRPLNSLVKYGSLGSAVKKVSVSLS